MIQKDLINSIKATAKEAGWKVIQNTLYRREDDYFLGNYGYGG